MRYVDLYSAEVSAFPEIASMLIRGDMLQPIMKVDDEEPLFGGGAFPDLVARLENLGVPRHGVTS